MSTFVNDSHRRLFSPTRTPIYSAHFRQLFGERLPALKKNLRSNNRFGTRSRPLCSLTRALKRVSLSRLLLGFFSRLALDSREGAFLFSYCLFSNTHTHTHTHTFPFFQESVSYLPRLLGVSFFPFFLFFPFFFVRFFLPPSFILYFVF